MEMFKHRHWTLETMNRTATIYSFQSLERSYAPEACGRAVHLSILGLALLREFL